MKNSFEYTEYVEKKNEIPWKKVLILLFLLIFIVVIILLSLKSCNKPSLKDDIISKAKEYYKINPNELPSEIATCKQITLNELEEAQLINQKDYETCDKTETYVNVCYLESKNYHYSANLACKETTSYGMWQDGEEKDLNENSDVRFLYLGELKNTGTKYYYPNNLTDSSKVKEYYLNPIGEYNNQDEKVTGYKWYLNQNVYTYYNNGEYTSIKPAGYNNKGKSKEVTLASTTRPSSYSYRVINEATIYRKKTVARPYIFFCNTSDSAVTAPIQSNTPCTGDTPYVVEILYTCDGTNNTTRGTVCTPWSDWTNETCSNSILNGIECESTRGYVYTDTKWQWYKTTTKKVYYPSNKSNVNDETTYYVTSPVENAIKDETTEAKVSKYYKIVNDGATNFEEWVTITDGYVTFEELIATFKKQQFNVNSLKDISSFDKIRYQYKLQYRNMK